MMKLSEAIRLGSMLRPQGFGPGSQAWYRFNATCALGAACHACAIKKDEDYESLGWLRLLDGIKPPCGCDLDLNVEDIPQFSSISHLNDNHRWTRERIADWVETIENQQVAAGPIVVERSEPTAKTSRD